MYYIGTQIGIFNETVTFGEVSEWFKEHAWKVCMRRKRIEGSNPSLSAINTGLIFKSINKHNFVKTKLFS